MAVVAASSHAVPVREFADGALDSRTHGISLLPGGALLFGSGPHLQVEEFSRRAAEFRSRPLDDPDAQAYLRFFFGSAEQVGMDRQGRLLVPQKLRAQVGIDREAVVMGLFDRLEIWPSRQWDQYEEKHVGAYRAGKLGPSGR